MAWIKIVYKAVVAVALCGGSVIGYAASSFSASADVGMGGEFPCSLDFLSGGQFGRNVTQTNQLATASASVTLDCTKPPAGLLPAVQFVAQASASAVGGRVRARSDTQTGEDLAFMNLNPNYPHGTASASFANDFRVRGPVTGKAVSVTLRFRLTGITDLGSSPFGPGVPWGFSGVTVNFGVTAESQTSPDDPNGQLVRFRDTFNFSSRSNANVPHDPVFELNLFLTPGKNYLLTQGLSTFAQGGALANYASTGVLEQIIAPAGYTPEIDGIALKQDGASFILEDAVPSGVKPAVTINLNSTNNPSVQGQSVTFSATVNASFAPTGTIQFKDGTTNLGGPLPLSGANAATLTSASLSVGDHAVTAEYSGDSNNASGSSLVLTQTVNAVNSGTTAQTINFHALAGKTLGDAPFSLSATASSVLPVSFTSQTANVCSVAGATVTIAAVGTCTIRASQAGDLTYLAAPDVDRSFTVSAATGSGSGGGGGCVLSAHSQIDVSLVSFLLLAAMAIFVRRKSMRRTRQS